MPSIGYSHITDQEAHPTTWLEFLTQQPKKQKWVFKHLKLINDDQPIIQAIQSGHAVVVSDRSYKDGQGTAAWMFHDLHDPKMSLGAGVLTKPGATRAQSSYQSELAGIYRVVSTINALTTFYKQPWGSILAVCDGTAALHKSMQPWSSNPLDKQFNIIQAIWAGIQKTKLHWTGEHIKGHQDQVALALCDKACWNDDMDYMAKQHWQHIQMSPDPTIHSLLREPWELWLENEKTSTAVKSRLLEHTSGQAAKAYWTNKMRFHRMDIQSINWIVIQSVVMAMMIKQW